MTNKTKHGRLDAGAAPGSPGPSSRSLFVPSVHSAGHKDDFGSGVGVATLHVQQKWRPNVLFYLFIFETKHGRRSSPRGWTGANRPSARCHVSRVVLCSRLTGLNRKRSRRLFSSVIDGINCDSFQTLSYFILLLLCFCASVAVHCGKDAERWPLKFLIL